MHGLAGGLLGRPAASHDARLRELTRRISRFALETNADYVVQTEKAFLQTVLDEPLDPAGAAHLDYVLGGTGAAQTAWLRAHARYFRDVESWVAAMAGMDFVFGTRLHGVIAGLLAGVPSLLITHDSRTEEMAEAAGIPALPMDAALAMRRFEPERLLALCDLDRFNARQRVYYRDFARFFDDNALPHRLRPDAPAPTPAPGREG